MADKTYREGKIRRACGCCQKPAVWVVSCGPHRREYMCARCYQADPVDPEAGETAQKLGRNTRYVP